MSDDPFLSVRGLVSGYGSTRVPQGIDFGVLRGSTVTFIRRNGVGKMTTLRSILGNVPSSEGTITPGGADITTLLPEKAAREGIIFVPEECRVFLSLAVSENVEIGCTNDRRDAEKPTVDATVDELESLARHQNSRDANLSGSEQQMPATAHVFVFASDLLLLDEPIEGLVPVVVKQVQREIEELNDDGAVADEVLDRYLGASMTD